MISGVIFTALRSLVNDRCYPSRFPQEDIAPPGTITQATNEPTWPAIRYTVVGAFNAADLDGTADVDTDDTTVQIDVVAKTYGAMITLRDDVINRMQAITDPPNNREPGFETWDADTKTHRAILTYTFFASSSGGVSP